MKRFDDLTLYEKNRFIESAAAAIFRAADEHGIGPVRFFLLIRGDNSTHATGNVSTELALMMMGGGILSMTGGGAQDQGTFDARKVPGGPKPQ